MWYCKGTPQALAELRQVYEYMDRAEAISSTDPEIYSGLHGFSSRSICLFLTQSRRLKVRKFAGPRYLAYRVCGYRDLDQDTKALESVERALQVTSDNPELFLKAQILAEQGAKQPVYIEGEVTSIKRSPGATSS